jgi:hypothetical protein
VSVLPDMHGLSEMCSWLIGRAIALGLPAFDRLLEKGTAAAKTAVEKAIAATISALPEAAVKALRDLVQSPPAAQPTREVAPSVHDAVEEALRSNPGLVSEIRPLVFSGSAAQTQIVRDNAQGVQANYIHSLNLNR